MDYKTAVETTVSNEHNKRKALSSQITDLGEKIKNSVSELQAYLDRTLEAMSTALSQRNGYRDSLSQKEKQIIEYVDSGKFQRDIENMPEMLAAPLKRSTRILYQKAKKKVPMEELVVCGYLDLYSKYDSEDPSKFQISLTIPVREEHKHQAGSLEEALYELNVVKGSFTNEGNNNGFIELSQEASLEKAVEIEKDMKTRFIHIPASSPLVKANVKYGIVYVRELPELPRPIQTEICITKEIPSVESKKAVEIDGNLYYPLSEASRIWENKMRVEECKDIPTRNIYGILKQSTTKVKERRFESLRRRKRKKDLIFLEKESFERFMKGHTISKIGELYRVVDLPQQTQPAVKKQYTIREAAELWRDRMIFYGVHVPHKNITGLFTSMRDKRRKDQPPIMFIQDQPGRDIYIEAKSLEKVMQDYIILPGEGTQKRYHVAVRPSGALHITDLIPRTVSKNFAANLLNLSRNSVNKKIRDHTFKTTSRGYITRESLTQYLQTRDGRANNSNQTDQKQESTEMSIHDAAELLDVDYSSILRKIWAKEIVKSGRGKVTRDSVEHYIQTHKKMGGDLKTLWKPR